ncbi:MAG TPA: hypothetical protein VK503_04430 [Candidatus Bathyarchaeia archaeon]|nr:hypothetical protein [Candidatus Bathyarchaeia archaeon]
MQLAKKHKLTATALHAAFLKTWAGSKAQCGELQIEIRLRGESSCTYMFSVKGKALAQASIKNDSVNRLKRLPDEFKGFLEDQELHSRKMDPSSISPISTLRYGVSGVSFKARVLKKSEVRAVTSKDGTPLLVCDLTLSDGTGEIPLAVWNSQIDTISKGDLVQIQNARVRSFRGEIQLSLNRKTGMLTVLKPATGMHRRTEKLAVSPRLIS